MIGIFDPTRSIKTVKHLAQLENLDKFPYIKSLYENPDKIDEVSYYNSTKGVIENDTSVRSVKQFKENTIKDFDDDAFINSNKANSNWFNVFNRYKLYAIDKNNNNELYIVDDKQKIQDIKSKIEIALKNIKLDIDEFKDVEVKIEYDISVSDKNVIDIDFSNIAQLYKDGQLMKEKITFKADFFKLHMESALKQVAGMVINPGWSFSHIEKKVYNKNLEKNSAFSINDIGLDDILSETKEYLQSHSKFNTFEFNEEQKTPTKPEPDVKKTIEVEILDKEGEVVEKTILEKKNVDLQGMIDKEPNVIKETISVEAELDETELEEQEDVEENKILSMNDREGRTKLQMMKEEAAYLTNRLDMIYSFIDQNEEMEKIISRNKVLEIEKEGLVKDKNDLFKKVEEIKEINVNLQKNVVEMTSINEELTNQNEELVKKTFEQQETIEEQTETIKELTTELDLSNKELLDQKETSEKLEKEVGKLQTTNKILEDKNGKLEEQLEKREKEYTTKMGELTERFEKITSSQQKIIEQQIKIVEEQKKEFQKSMDQKNSDLAEAQNKMQKILDEMLVKDELLNAKDETILKQEQKMMGLDEISREYEKVKNTQLPELSNLKERMVSIKKDIEEGRENEALKNIKRLLKIDTKEEGKPQTLKDKMKSKQSRSVDVDMSVFKSKQDPKKDNSSPSPENN